MIYFVRRASGIGPVKIGTTTKLKARLKALSKKAGEPLAVLGVIDGDRLSEGDLHGRFSDLREEGEWFGASEELLAFVKSASRPWDGRDEVVKKGIRLDFDDSQRHRLSLVAKSKGLGLAAYARQAVLQTLIADETRDRS